MDVENLVGSYAFPIVMCLWFMFKTEKTIKANTDATVELRNVIVTYTEKFPNSSLKAN